ncbi:MAG: flagellar basal body rod protein FlgB [Planctomycetes bacterium]|nr:flagellar basal body rod protein FlgB [Planctomycetota bacterium]
MWIERLTTSRVTHALELTARFAEERHKVLAENVANIDTPDYHTKRLDAEVFQKTLKNALQRSEGSGATVLELRGEAQVSTTPDGRLTVRPQVRPADNILFHDGRNASLETLMTEVQQNALDYSLATRLLSKRFDGLLTAIRGRTT